MKTMTRYSAFMIGVWASAFGYGLFQDIEGQAGMQELLLLREHWVSAWVTVPIEIIGLAVCMVLLAKAIAADNVAKV